MLQVPKQLVPKRPVRMLQEPKQPVRMRQVRRLQVLQLSCLRIHR